MKKLIFFNQFHNGDCFVGKGYVKELMANLPGVEFAYAHNNHKDILKDLNIEHLGLNNIPPMDRMTKVAESPDKETVFVNTWVGCWQGEKFPYGQHINFTRLHEIWREYFKYFNIDFKKSFHEYLPTIDFNYFDLGDGPKFVEDGAPIILFCNGPANSGQSMVGDMAVCISAIAEHFPDYKIVLTHSVDVKAPNIFNVRPIFNQDSDLNQISWLASKSKLIIGKNSGPFSYCQSKDNLLNPDLTFLNLSVLPTDCPSGSGLYKARCLFSNAHLDYQIHDIITTILKLPEYRGTELIL